MISDIETLPIVLFRLGSIKVDGSYVMGITSYSHGSSVVILRDNDIVYAAEEERFTRVKNDSSFPINSIKKGLEFLRISPDDIRSIGYYENPYLKLARIISFPLIYGLPKESIEYATYFKRVVSALQRLLPFRFLFRADLLSVDRRFRNVPVIFCNHHLSHALAGALTSGFDDAKILVVDAVGEFLTMSGWRYEKGFMPVLTWGQNLPVSVGLFYSAVTSYCGFKVDSGEYKLMGLAPFGSKSRFIGFMNRVISYGHSTPSGLNVDLDYFSYGYGTHIYSKRWEAELGFPPRGGNSIKQEYCDLAAACQAHLECILLSVLGDKLNLNRMDNFVFSGGVAMNCVLNSAIRERFELNQMHIFISPTDAGSALGAACFSKEYKPGSHPRLNYDHTSADAVLLGPSYAASDVVRTLNYFGLSYKAVPSGDEPTLVANLLIQGAVVAIFRGRMEFGQRALGSRSIIALASGVANQQRVNLKIKFRESFRPFAPVMRRKIFSTFFETNGQVESPFMQYTFKVKESNRYPDNFPQTESQSIAQRLLSERCDYSSVVHVDYSSRVQTVSEDSFFGQVLAILEQQGENMILNTSFNRRGEPIVESPADAIAAFLHTEIDYLLFEGYLLDRSDLRSVKNRSELERVLVDD